MTMLLRIIGGVWLALGAWVLWRNIEALSGVTAAVQPVGSSLVTNSVVSTLLVFVGPGLAALLLAGALSGKRAS